MFAPSLLVNSQGSDLRPVGMRTFIQSLESGTGNSLMLFPTNTTLFCVPCLKYPFNLGPWKHWNLFLCDDVNCFF